MAVVVDGGMVGDGDGGGWREAVRGGDGMKQLSHILDASQRSHSES